MMPKRLPINGLLFCSSCKQNKCPTLFYRNTDTASGRGSYCKECIKAVTMRWKAKDPERAKRAYRKTGLKSAYNLTIEQYDQMLNKQGGVCKICKTHTTKRRLGVDHDHKTGKVRSLLCGWCNIGIGSFKENPKLLQEAIWYINNYREF